MDLLFEAQMKHLAYFKMLVESNNFLTLAMTSQYIGDKVSKLSPQRDNMAAHL